MQTFSYSEIYIFFAKSGWLNVFSEKSHVIRLLEAVAPQVFFKFGSDKFMWNEDLLGCPRTHVFPSYFGKLESQISGFLRFLGGSEQPVNSVCFFEETISPLNCLRKIVMKVCNSYPLNLLHIADLRFFDGDSFTMNNWKVIRSKLTKIHLFSKSKEFSNVF